MQKRGSFTRESKSVPLHAPSLSLFSFSLYSLAYSLSQNCFWNSSTEEASISLARASQRITEMTPTEQERDSLQVFFLPKERSGSL